jgi:hypothetical protein
MRFTRDPGVGTDSRLPTRDRWLTLTAIAAIAAILAVSAFKVAPLLNPDPIQLATVDTSCDLGMGPCTAHFSDGGSVTLHLEPRGIPPLTKLRLAVFTQGIDASSVQIDFAGADMNMGFNRPTLTGVAPGRYRGEGMLPICVRDRMVWEARVLLETPQGLLAAPFRFETTRSP